MKYVLIGIFLSVLGGCAAVTADPWGWLDDPAQQQWVEMLCEFPGTEIQLAVPNRLKGKTHRFRSYPLVEVGETSVPIPGCTDFPNTNLVIAMFDWDYWWGGFFKDKGADFHMTVSVLHHENSPQFLDLDVSSWIGWRTEYWQSVYGRPPRGSVEQLQKFLDGYSIEPFHSKSSVTWVLEEYPTVTGRMFEFHAPLSNSDTLTIRFQISGVRGGLEPDPAWQERRLQMAFSIMNKVAVSPSIWNEPLVTNRPFLDVADLFYVPNMVLL